MTFDGLRLLGLIGPAGILVTLIVVALLSQRLGSVTRTRPYYIGFYVAAGSMAVSMLARLMDANPTAGGITAVIFYVGLPVVAVTIGVIVAWRYWSWLFAERS